MFALPGCGRAGVASGKRLKRRAGVLGVLELGDTKRQNKGHDLPTTSPEANRSCLEVPSSKRGVLGVLGVLGEGCGRAGVASGKSSASSSRPSAPTPSASFPGKTHADNSSASSSHSSAPSSSASSPGKRCADALGTSGVKRHAGVLGESSVAKRSAGVMGVLAAAGGHANAGSRVCSAWPAHGRHSKMAARAALSAVGASAAGAVSDMAGRADETHAAHKARHPRFHPHCPRCIYDELHAGWERGHGCHRHCAAGNEVRTVWLAQRPAHLGGVWGLGCIFCAAYNSKRGPQPRGVKRGKMGSSGRWSRFEVRALSQMGSRAVRQHADTLTHRLATRAYFVPDCL